MASQDLIEDLQFTCPKCGSHCFGTSCPGIVEKGFTNDKEREAFFLENAMGECHGACDFTWLRKNDSLYFKPTGNMRPRIVYARST